MSDTIRPGRFVIRWGEYGYVTWRSPNRKPYTTGPDDADTKRWKTRSAAERFLAGKDDQWAGMCTIEERVHVKTS